MASKQLFIFEMANNHMGSVSHGIHIIQELREACAGFDFRFAIKLQYRDIPNLVHPAYKTRLDLKFIKRFTETALTWDECLRLKEAIVAHGFIPICSPWDEASVDKVAEHGFHYLKVASCCLTDWPLAEKIAATKLPVILSTAGEPFEEVDRIVSFYQHRNKQVSILHCVGEYPTSDAHLNLNQIDLLRHRYTNVEVGYSTHESPTQLDSVKMAIAKGATIFEKHVGIPTADWPLNAYSATPLQVRRWLEAAASALSIAGVEHHRHAFSDKEHATLSELRRGVFARWEIPAGSIVKQADVFLAIPAVSGQVVANDLSKYTEFKALQDFVPNAAVMHAGVTATDTRSAVNGIVRDVKALLKASDAVVPTQLELEISHHYGIARFREIGSAMITVINREYCKRLILMLPGQWHPEHWHTLKDETFHLLHGEVELVLGGKRRIWVKNDVIVIPRGVKHEFRTTTGAVIEEISSTHSVNDSAYSDPAISASVQRKTFVTNWMD